MFPTNKRNKKYIKKFKFRDFLIIFLFWAVLNLLPSELLNINFRYTPFLEGYFHLLFKAAGRFIFLGLLIFYLISLYDTGFKELGLSIKDLLKDLAPAFNVSLMFFILVMLFIYLPLSFTTQQASSFNPLFSLESRDTLLTHLGGLLLIFPPALLIGFSEQFILNNVVFELFNLKLPFLLSIIMAALFYPLILFDLGKENLIINFLFGIIVIYLYQKAERSLFLPGLFAAVYYTLFSGLIFGWDFFFRFPFF